MNSVFSDLLQSAGGLVYSLFLLFAYSVLLYCMFFILLYYTLLVLLIYGSCKLIYLLFSQDFKSVW